LGDFGFSQVLDDKDLVVNALKVFNMKGLTVAYVAPEVLLRFNTRSDEQTMKTLNWQAKDFKRADVYSLSLLLYEIMVCNSAWGN
jgi:serine/threonine protein kinase